MVGNWLPGLRLSVEQRVLSGVPSIARVCEGVLRKLKASDTPGLEVPSWTVLSEGSEEQEE